MKITKTQYEFLNYFRDNKNKKNQIHLRDIPERFQKSAIELVQKKLIQSAAHKLEFNENCQIAIDEYYSDEVSAENDSIQTANSTESNKISKAALSLDLIALIVSAISLIVSVIAICK